MHYPLLAGIVLAGACLLMLPYRPGVAATVLIAMVVVATMIAGRREGFDSTTAANYGDYIEIQHVTTAARDPTTGFLVNSPASYWKTGSSMQISVNCAADQHWQSIWRLRGPASSQLPSGPVKDGDTIRLQERFTGRLLSGSGTTPADGPAGSAYTEVASIPGSSDDDTSANWVLQIVGGGVLASNSTFSLKHATSGLILLSTNYQRQLYATKPDTQQLVALTTAASADTVWEVHRVESRPGAVRFYTDINNSESAMDAYVPVTAAENVITNPRASLIGLIVPEGYTVDLYASPNKQQYMASFSSGKYDALNLQLIKTTVIHPYCAATFWDSCNMTGQKACVGFGPSLLPFQPQSWTYGTNSAVKLFTASADVTPPVGNMSCYSASGQGSSGVEAVAVYPAASPTQLFRNPQDASSLASFAVPAVDVGLPSKASIVVHLNGAVPQSYGGSGRIWRDISGNNHHFVWQNTPRWCSGRFMTTDIDGQGAIGDPSSRLGLGTGVQGYTVAFVVSAYMLADGGALCGLVDTTGKPAAVSCVAASADGSLTFGNAINSKANNGDLTLGKNRVQVASSPGVWDPFATSVVVCRRSSNSNSRLLSIWVNGKKQTESTSPAADLEIGSGACTLFTTFKGSAQAFVLYNTGLNDSDVGTLGQALMSTWAAGQHRIEVASVAAMKQMAPDVPVTQGLRCLLDARNSNSAMYGSAVWRDVSGYGNHFTWTNAPALSYGRFRQINTAGSGLSGPPSDSFDIGTSGGYTCFVAAQTNGLSQNQAFRLNSSIDLQSRAVFMSPSWTDGNIYFDQGGCCTANSQRVTAPSVWEQYSVMTIRRTPPVSSYLDQSRLNKMAIFVNGALQTEGTAQAANAVFNRMPAEIGASKTEGLDWKADIGAFALFNRALTDDEVMVMANWMNNSLQASPVRVDGSTDTDPTIKPGPCIDTTGETGQYFSRSQCVSKVPNADGTFSPADSDGDGWCYTDTKGGWGYCRDPAVDTDKAFDRSQSLAYADARAYCEAKGGRLCNYGELCNNGAGTRARVGYDTLNAADCAAVGGVYGTQSGQCGTAASGGKVPFYTPTSEQYAPINDYNNAWVYLGNDNPSNLCRTADQITGSTPSWGTTAQDLPYKRNLVCCDVGSLSACDLLSQQIQTVNDQLAGTTDAGTVQSLTQQKNSLVTQQQETCLSESYEKAVTDLNTYEGQYSGVQNQVTQAQGNQQALSNQLYTLTSVVDSKGTSFANVADAQARGGVPFPDGTFHPSDQIPDVNSSIGATQLAIQQQMARLQSCPPNATCPVPQKSAAQPVNPAATTCSPADLTNSLLSNPRLPASTLQQLRNALNPSTILAGTDIRRHKDFYTLVKAGNVMSCDRLPDGGVEQPDASSFDITQYPGFKGNYQLIDTFPADRIPADRMADYQRLQGTANQTQAS